MRLQAFDILARHREHPNQLASAADFTVAPAGDSDARAVLDDPHVTLYCLDAATRRALFVETPREVDLHAETFLYQAQFRHATRLFALPYEDFLAAGDLRGDPRENVVFLYSVGRCGSTLLSNAFRRLDDVLSISEPNAPSQLLGAANDPETAALLRSAVRLHCKPHGGGHPAHYVIKFRAEGTRLAAPLQRLFPASRAVFLYRDVVPVVRSYLRAFHPLPATVPAYHEDPVRFVTRFCLSSMHHYLLAREQGVPLQAYRYEDLVDDPRAVFSQLARWSGIPVTGLDDVLTAFSEDSQEGSNLARRSLDGKAGYDVGTIEELTARVRAALADHPTLHDPSPLLPGTWQPGAGQANA